MTKYQNRNRRVSQYRFGDPNRMMALIFAVWFVMFTMRPNRNKINVGGGCSIEKGISGWLVGNDSRASNREVQSIHPTLKIVGGLGNGSYRLGSWI